MLDEASAEGLSLTVALERLLAAEVDASTARRLAGRLRFACLPTPATLADFDVDAAAGIDRKLIEELGTCRYLESATNILLIGPSVIEGSSAEWLCSSSSGRCCDRCDVGRWVDAAAGQFAP